MAVNNIPVAAILPVAGATKAAEPAKPADAAAPAAATPATATPGAPVAGAAPATTGDTAAVGGGVGDPAEASLLPTSLPSESMEAPKIKGGGVTSVGDPHETTGDGMKFDNMRVGNFVKQRAKSGDFELQTKQEPWDRNPQATVNTAAAIKVNKTGDVVKIDASKDTISVGGKPITVKDGETFEIPGGGSIKKNGESYEVTSAAGDKVTAMDRGSYMDISSEAGPERRDGDISGSLGRLDSDNEAGNDLVGRDGKPMEDQEKFLDEWTVQPGEDLLGEAPVGGGAAPAPAVDPNAPVAADPNAPIAADPNAPVAADPNAPAVDLNAPVAADPNAPVAPAAPAAPADTAALLKQIKDLITKLKADPANAGNMDMLNKIDALLGPAEGGEEKPAADLKNEVVNANPGGNTQIEELLKLLMQFLEQQEAERAAKVPA